MLKMSMFYFFELYLSNVYLLNCTIKNIYNARIIKLVNKSKKLQIFLKYFFYKKIYFSARRRQKPY